MREELLKYNRKKRLRNRIFWIFIILVAILIWLTLRADKNLESTPLYSNNNFRAIYHSGNRIDARSKIALIKVEGVILNSTSSWDVIANANDISDQLYDAEKNPDVKAIILYIDSPGGEVSAVDKIYHQIEDIRSHGKKVIALIDSIGASGGYYIAAPCDKIIAGRLSITGSIGVILNSYKYYNLLGKIGVQDEVFKSGEMKDMLNPARPTTLKEQELVKELLKESYDVFVTVVSNGRIGKNKELTCKYIKGSIIGDGRIFSGEEALKLGLVDQLGYYKDAVDAAIKLANLNKNKVQIISYEEKVSFSDLIERLFYSKTKLNLEIPGIKRNALQSGNMYYLYPPYQQ